jgi:nucleotide-binding universal stress UspA family protein
MPFEKILIGLDGSKNSQLACEWAFWLTTKLGAKLSALYVNDPRFDDLFIEPEFAEELGFRKFVESSETVSNAFHQIGSLILDFFKREAAQRNLSVATTIRQGQIVDELVSTSAKQDLLIVGHRSPELRNLPVQTLLGPVSESVAIQADVPVLLAMSSPSQIEELLIAFDGSEASREALLMAEVLAKLTGRRLKGLCVAQTKEDMPGAEAIAEEGRAYLRESWEYPIFSVKVGPISETIINFAAASNALVIVGESGINSSLLHEPLMKHFGTTAFEMIHQDKVSVLVYKPPHRIAEKSDVENTRSSASQKCEGLA